MRETEDLEGVNKSMKTRIITAVLIIFFLIGVMLLDSRVLGVVMFLLSIVATYEYVRCFDKTTYKPIKVISYVSTLWLLPLAFVKNVALSSSVGALLIYCLVLMLALCGVFGKNKYNIVDLAITMFGIFYIPFLFSFVTLTRAIPNGAYYIWIIFIGSCVTDTFAYFVGILFGKHKLLPSVSPKKTIEGSVGGIIGTVGVMVLYGQYLGSINITDMSLYWFALLGFATSVVSQLGDLFASSIKRFVGVKDYGSILPGHGGILDRFDSIMFIAPIIYFSLR